VVELTPRFQRDANRLSTAERELVAAALRQLPQAIGRPHVHTGLGIRRLRRDLFECRAGQRLRVLFFAAPGRLTCYAVGDHDEVADLLKNL
jgi:mRNA-degrading endonuclease RelE of RelBE toxin-antitoxin system